MLCLKAEALWGETLDSQAAVPPVNLRSPIRKATRRGARRDGGGGLKGNVASDSSSSPSSGERCRHSEETKSIIQGQKVDPGKITCCYRLQLEKEVQMLEKQLQEEIDLHAALGNAVANTVLPLPRFPTELPSKTEELIASIEVLEITIKRLEEELFALHFSLQNERRERRAAEINKEYIQMSSHTPLSSNLGYIWEERASSSVVSKHGGQVPASIHHGVLPGSEVLRWPVQGQPETIPVNEVLGSCNEEKEKRPTNTSLVKGFKLKNLAPIPHPNILSEEMVLSMRNIFLRLSISTTSASRTSLSEWLSWPSSSARNLTRSFTSLSASSRLRTSELLSGCEIKNQEGLCNPYGVNKSMTWRDVGKYRLATEVSWMSIGKAQLEYAAESLKKFRCMVEQLARVSPDRMTSDEKLAFWINLYNALIMHTYLAYGVPKSDIKLFSLMQKACYTVGGQSFSALDIEFVILKMKPPAHRPQIALALALHKFKTPEEQRGKCSIHHPEPLVLFALSCGMHSCPAVRLFRPRKVKEELRESMKEYIQASVGVNEEGKLMVPKLLYLFVREAVEDSLLVDWICRHLNPAQLSFLRHSAPRLQRLLRATSFCVVPFDSTFRYLFLPPQ